MRPLSLVAALRALPRTLLWLAKARVRSAVRRWLGIPNVEYHLAELMDAHHESRKRLESELLTLALELRARLDGHQTDLVVCDGLLTQYATTLHRLAGIVHGHNALLARWAQGSETLRMIEARHTRQQQNGKILPLPDSRLLGGN